MVETNNHNRPHRQQLGNEETVTHAEEAHHPAHRLCTGLPSLGPVLLRLAPSIL